MAWRKKNIGQQQHLTKALQLKGKTVKNKFAAFIQMAGYFLPYEIHFMDFLKSSKRNVWSLQNFEHFRSWTGSVLGGLRVGRMFLGAEAGWMRAQLQPGQGIRIVWEESQGLEKATRLNFLCMKGELKVF